MRNIPTGIGSKWMSIAARSLHGTGAGTAIETITDYVKAASHGGVTAAALSELSGQDSQSQGQFIGGGMGLGALGRLERGVSGAEASAKHEAALQGDFNRFIDHLRENKTPESVLTKIQTDPQLKFQAMQAATLRSIFGDKLGFAFLDNANYQHAAENGGYLPPEAIQPIDNQNSASNSNGTPKGTSAFYSPAENKIFINADSARARDGVGGHEAGHALAKAMGGDPEIQLLVDGIFTQEEQKAIGREYAEALVKGHLRATGESELRVKNPAAYEKLVADQLDRLDQSQGPNWVAGEIMAEGTYGVIYGKDITKELFQNDTLRSFRERLSRRLNNAEFLQKLPESGQIVLRSLLGLTSEGIPHPLFRNLKVYEDPQLRRSIFSQLRKMRKFGDLTKTVKDGKDGLPAGNSVPKEMYGKSEAVPMEPNPSTGRLENDAAVKDPSTGEVTLRKPFEIRRIEKARQDATKQTFATQKPLPKNDDSLDVAPRTLGDGSVEISGTRIANQIERMEQFGETARANARMIDEMIGTGDVLDVWYQKIGSSPNWKWDVKRRLGNIAAAKIKLAPYAWKVSKEGNVLVVGLSLSAFTRKMQRWAREEKLDLWNGDVESFLADAKQYLSNHASARPGEEGIGVAKRDKLNAFIGGANKTYQSFNPLREHLRGEDRGSVLRSLRLDRMGSAEIAPDAGWDYNHNNILKNLSPDMEPNARASADGQISLPESGTGSPPSENQKQSSEPYRPVEASPKPVPDDLNDAGFYSAAERAIEANMANKAPAATVKAILRNPQNGVKADEIKWTGLDDFLNTKPTFTKEEVVAYIKSNRVEIREVMKGEGHIHQFGTPEEQAEAVQRQAAAQKAFFDPNVTEEERPALHEEYKAANKNAAEKVPGYGKYEGYEDHPVMFDEYALPGGENYRELLFMLPVKEGADTYQVPQAHQYRDGESDVNRLGHVRFSDRVDIEDKKVRLIDEIQSDMLQDARKFGFKSEAEAKRQVLEAQLKDAPISEKPAIRRQLRDLKNAVPDAPFRSSWPEMFMRRMLRLAAEQGMDKLAWTPGDIQADRYKQSKLLSSVEATRLSSGDFQIKAFRKTGGAPATEVMSINEVARKLGKDLADKIQIQEADSQKYSGLSLKVGGDGMRAFYDRMLVQYMEKYCKKWGTEVGSTEIPIPAAEGEEGPGTIVTVHSVDITPAMHESVMNQGQPQFSPEGATAKPVKRNFKAAALARAEARRLASLPANPNQQQE
ncbi:MAG: hypothetical protein JWQ71_4983 [Pedosphaera sp.]|nr:hypothetical protein [Pedosphaera sp.]